MLPQSNCNCSNNSQITQFTFKVVNTNFIFDPTYRTARPIDIQSSNIKTQKENYWWFWFDVCFRSPNNSIKIIFWLLSSINWLAFHSIAFIWPRRQLVTTIEQHRSHCLALTSVPAHFEYHFSFDRARWFTKNGPQRKTFRAKGIRGRDSLRLYLRYVRIHMGLKWYDSSTTIRSRMLKIFFIITVRNRMYGFVFHSNLLVWCRLERNESKKLPNAPNGISSMNLYFDVILEPKFKLNKRNIRKWLK